MSDFHFILLIFIIYILYINKRNKIIYPLCFIELKNSNINYLYQHKYINYHFIIFHMNYRKYINISDSKYYVEHNLEYDDISFLLPLYSIIIKSKIIVICSGSYVSSRKVKEIYKINNYTTYNNCIYIDITFLKYLHIHSNIFRFCKYRNVFDIFKNKRIILHNKRICKSQKYSYTYSVVTTIYRRNNAKKQIQMFLNQSIPPKSIIVVHDRNIVIFPFQHYPIIYVHTLNFEAGFYFRYIIALLSPENEVIMYDDDWFTHNSFAHEKWINDLKDNDEYYFGHHTGNKNGINWCATPLIIHRKWLYLMWYYKIYEVKWAEDLHLSFSLLLLCNIKCDKKKLNGVFHKNDKLATSKIIKLPQFFFDHYINNITNEINSSYISGIKHKYQIF